MWDLSKPERMKTKDYKENVTEIFPPGHDGAAAAARRASAADDSAGDGVEETKGEEPLGEGGDEGGGAAFSSIGNVAVEEARKAAEEAKAEAEAKSSQPRAEVWYQKEGTAVAATPLPVWAPDAEEVSFEVNYVTPWSIGYVDPNSGEEVMMIDRHALIPSVNATTISTRNEELSIKIIIKYWSDELGKLLEAKPFGRIKIKGLIPADVIKGREKYNRRKMKKIKHKQGEDFLKFEQTVDFKFKMSVRGFLEVDLTCDPMSAKSAVKLVPRPKVPELRPGNWVVFMGVPFVVTHIVPPDHVTFEDDAKVGVTVKKLEEGLPGQWTGSHMLDYGERECDIPYDQVKHLLGSGKGMTEQQKKEADEIKKRPVSKGDVVQVPTNLYDVDANPEYKQFRHDVMGDEVTLDYVPIDKKFYASQLKAWEAQVQDQIKNYDNVALEAAGADDEEEEEPKFLGLNPEWLTRRHVNAAEMFHINEENKAAEREAQLRMANETRRKLEETGVIELTAKATEEGQLLVPIQKGALIKPMEEAVDEQLDHAEIKIEQVAALGEFPYTVGLGHGVVAQMTLVVVKG